MIPEARCPQDAIVGPSKGDTQQGLLGERLDLRGAPVSAWPLPRPLPTPPLLLVWKDK